MVRRGLSRALRRAGHAVVAVERCSGIRQLRQDFDVAVLDLELPDGSGLDVASALLSEGAAQDVVFFSGAADSGLLARAGRLGEVVQKSADLGVLLNAVATTQLAEPLQRCARPVRPRARTLRR